MSSSKSAKSLCCDKLIVHVIWLMRLATPSLNPLKEVNISHRIQCRLVTSQVNFPTESICRFMSTLPYELPMYVLRRSTPKAACLHKTFGSHAHRMTHPQSAPPILVLEMVYWTRICLQRHPKTLWENWSLALNVKMKSALNGKTNSSKVIPSQETFHPSHQGVNGPTQSSTWLLRDCGVFTPESARMQLHQTTPRPNPIQTFQYHLTQLVVELEAVVWMVMVMLVEHKIC